MIKVSLRSLSTAEMGPLGMSLPVVGMHLNRLFATGFRPNGVRDFLRGQAKNLHDIKAHSCLIEDRGLAASLLRFAAMFDKLSPGLREAATAPRGLDELWSPDTLETIDRDIHTILQTHPACSSLLANEARLWWRFDPIPGATTERKLTRDEMRALVMHTHAGHSFFELHGFVQRAERSGLADLSKWFAPNLIGLRGAYNKLMLNGFGVDRTVRKGLRDGPETDSMIHRLRNNGPIYMPMSSWGDTTFCFVEKNEYSCVLESEVRAVDVTLFGKAFLRHSLPSVYKEYLVPESRIALMEIGRSFVKGSGYPPAFGKDFDVFKVKQLPGGRL